jgi:hypothetical protein
MSWLEKECARKRAEISKWNIQEGDFINLTLNQGDVWHEVKEIVDNRWVVVYNHANSQEIKSYDISYVRKLCRKENVEKIRTCYVATKDRLHKRTFPMDANAYSFKGDKHISQS